MKKWQDITEKRKQQQQWEKCSEQRKAAMDVTNTSMVDVLPLFLRSVLHAEGIEMNLNMLIHHDDFHLATFSIIQEGEIKPSIKKGKDYSRAKRALGSGALRTGTTIAVALAAADGPLPVGDTIAAGVLIGAGAWAYFTS